MSEQLPFAGRHTAQKLEIVEKYCRGYLTALSRQSFHKVYVDTFAGTGRVPFSGASSSTLSGVGDFDSELEGSAIRALRLDPGFDEYVFADKSASHIKALGDQIETAFPTRVAQSSLLVGDANDAIMRFVESRDWGPTRAVVFLDPFGNQIKWSTVEALGRTRGVDLWYLFPAGLGVSRQVSRSGEINPSAVHSINEMLGTKEWQDLCVKTESSSDLFGETRELSYKTATPGLIADFVVRRLNEVFNNGACSSYIPLGKDGRFDYALVFACANERGRRPALNIANGILKKAKEVYGRGRTKRH